MGRAFHKDTVEVGVFDPEEMDLAMGQEGGEGPLLLPLQQQPHEVLDLPQPHVPLVVAADQRLRGGGGGVSEAGGTSTHPKIAHPVPGVTGVTARLRR